MTTRTRKHTKTETEHVDPFSDPHSSLLWGPDQVCKTLACGLTTLNEMIASGQFPEPFRIGRGKRIRRWLVDDVLRWIKEQNTPAGAGPGRPRSGDQ